MPIGCIVYENCEWLIWRVESTGHSRADICSNFASITVTGTPTWIRDGSWVLLVFDDDWWQSKLHLSYQHRITCSYRNLAMTGVGESGFHAGEEAFETAFTTKGGSRRVIFSLSLWWRRHKTEWWECYILTSECATFTLPNCIIEGLAWCQQPR